MKTRVALISVKWTVKRYFPLVLKGLANRSITQLHRSCDVSYALCGASTRPINANNVSRKVWRKHGATCTSTVLWSRDIFGVYCTIFSFKLLFCNGNHNGVESVVNIVQTGCSHPKYALNTYVFRQLHIITRVSSLYT